MGDVDGMDVYTAVLLGAVLLVVLVVALRWLTIMERNAAETLAQARERAERIAIANGYNPKKGGKKAKKPKEDDDDQVDMDDPVVRVLDHPVVRGMAQRFGVDVDLVLDGDEQELQKVESLLSRVKGAGGGAPVATDAALLG